MFKNLLSKIFGKVVEVRNKNFDEKQEITKCRIPVISVGNLSVGGTGKTPFVAMLTKYLQSRKKTPGIIGKGYKRQSKGDIVVCDGKNILVDAETGGDEMVLLANALNVPVMAVEEKWKGALEIQDKFDIDCIIVDDGFQHRQLSRDLDIVLIDKETLDNPELMPKGRLREPLSSLSRADIVCLAGNIPFDEKIKPFVDETTIVIRVKPLQTNPYEIRNKQILKLHEVKNVQKGVIAFAGIAKPLRFFDMIASSGYNLIEKISYDDHHNYKNSDLEKIKEICDKNRCFNLATTEKDAAKLLKYKEFFELHNINCYVYPISLQITEGKENFFKAVNNLFKKGKSYEKS